MKNQALATALMGALVALTPIYAVHEDPAVVEDDFETVFYSVTSNIGRNIVWGGEVIDFQRASVGVRLTIREIPLDKLGQDNGIRSSRGRFVAQSTDNLTADQFGLGKLCIVRGKVSGSVTLPLGDQQYTYPVVTAEAVHPCGTDSVVALLRKAGAPSPVSIKGPFCNETAMEPAAPAADPSMKKMHMKGLKANRDTAAQNTVIGYWTCTMHPEVHQAGPGNCPKCGMKLVFYRSDKDTADMRTAEQGK